MQINKIFENSSYKVMEANLSKGEIIPSHIATSEAFIIVKRGKGKIVFEKGTVELREDSTHLIPANQKHTLEVSEDFSACIIFENKGEIEFVV